MWFNFAHAPFNESDVAALKNCVMLKESQVFDLSEQYFLPSVIKGKN